MPCHAVQADRSFATFFLALGAQLQDANWYAPSGLIYQVRRDHAATLPAARPPGRVLRTDLGTFCA
jgi:hypothetical protein